MGFFSRNQPIYPIKPRPAWGSFVVRIVVGVALGTALFFALLDGYKLIVWVFLSK